MIEAKENLIGEISSKEVLFGSLNNGIEKVYPALQEKEVTPSGVVQEIIPDDGVYGLSKVTIDKISLQTKNVTPSKNQQIITADEEFSGLDSVTVEKVLTEEKTITPSKNTQIIEASEDKFISKVIVNGDNNLVPENIVEGKTIFGIQGEAQSSSWKPEPDWWDIKSIIENDNTINPETGKPFGGKFIFLISDYYDKLIINKMSNYHVYMIKTSDGATYTNIETSTNHIWDKSKDKLCSKGYKTRYVIVYTDENVITPYSFTPFSNHLDLYRIYDCNLCASNYTLNMQSQTVQCIEFINNKKVISNKSITLSNNHSIIEYRFDIQLEADYNVTGQFTNNFWCKKYPNFINSNFIKSFSSWFSGNSSVEEIGNFNLSNLSGSNVLNNSFYNCTNLKKISNIIFPNSYISYQDFLKQTRIAEIKTNGILKATSLYNAFYQTQIKNLDIDMDTSKCTNFGYFGAFNYVLESISSELDFSSCTNTTQIFYDSNKLKHVKIKNLATSTNLSHLRELSQESINYLVEHIADLTGKTSQQLILGANIDKLSDEQKLKLTNYNWSVSR